MRFNGGLRGKGQEVVQVDEWTVSRSRQINGQQDNQHLGHGQTEAAGIVSSLLVGLLTHKHRMVVRHISS